jgi:hypothetical protein
VVFPDVSEQFRVSAIQEIVEDGAIDLTLSKMEEFFNVEGDNDTD